ncbi:efflux RND transporter periplasmic adaptor subunit [Thalassolituus sp. LLYu03]|uniref:efflux RND transporter periplasmic adaptor subunit n=1 Tax=Thalassolituus sp. LLYu03 TaxID=3421656 RepID=UPI003D2DB268
MNAIFSAALRPLFLNAESIRPAIFWLLLSALIAAPAMAGSEHDHESENHESEEHDAEEHDSEQHDAEEHEHGAEHDDEHDHEPQSLHLDEKARQDNGIETAIAGPAQVEQHHSLYARLITPPGAQINVSARFPGLIQSLKVQPGERVQKGQVLAIIESNDSLRPYPLTAPINGVVSQLQAGAGELTPNNALLTITDPERIWAELTLFGDARQQVQTGQAVHIEHGDHQHTQPIQQLVSDGVNPWSQALAPLTHLASATAEKNTCALRAGETTRAWIDVQTIQAAVAVDNRALQEMDGRWQVFIQQGDTFSARPVQLGVRGDKTTEIKSGLHAGDIYVVRNSYLLKAEQEKSAAGHEH